MSYNKYYHPTTWEDFPSENTAIDAQRLNHLEDGVDELDDRICQLDVNKSQVSWNQQLLTGDKIAEISINGVVKSVYAPNVDGASQQAQAAALVSEGHAQGTQGGSAVGPGSQYYHNNAKYYAEQASTSFDNKIASEGYALGTENGDPVTSGSIYYHNNAKYYAEQARSFTPEGYQELVDEVEEKIDKSDVDVKSVTTGKFDTVTGGLMQKCEVELEPIQSGSGVPSPSNVRTISGHTQVQVGNCGKNKLPNNATTTTTSGVTFTVDSDGVVTTTGTATADISFLIDFTANKTGNYYFNGCANGGNLSTTFDVFVWDKTNGRRAYKWNGSTASESATDASQKQEIKLEKGVNYSYRIRIRNGFATSGQKFYPMIFNPSDSADFEPYNGYTKVINLGGTYYGGTLDAVSGKFTVTHALYSNTWGNGTGATDLGSVTRKTYDFTSVGLSKNEATTSRMNCADYLNSWAENSTHYTINASSHKDLYLFLPNGTSSDFVFQLCFELATPFTIQLDPQTLETLVGQNDVFAPLDGQSVDKVDYKKIFTWDDVKTYVDSKIS